MYSFFNSSQYWYACIDIFKKCSKENCSSHGICVFSDSNKANFRCECASGWTGLACNERISTPCQFASIKLQVNLSMVCLNGGTCVNNANGVDFSCECLKGWFGKRCEIFFVQVVFSLLEMQKVFAWGNSINRPSSANSCLLSKSKTT